MEICCWYCDFLYRGASLVYSFEIEIRKTYLGMIDGTLNLIIFHLENIYSEYASQLIPTALIMDLENVYGVEKNRMLRANVGV